MITILYIEREESDRELLEIAFQHVHPDAVLNSVDDPAKAISYLRGERGFENRRAFPSPDVVVIGVETGSSAEDFLRWKLDSQFKDLPVIALTDDLDYEAIVCSKRHGAMITLPKPSLASELFEVVQGISKLDFSQLLELERAVWLRHLQPV